MNYFNKIKNIIKEKIFNLTKRAIAESLLQEINEDIPEPIAVGKGKVINESKLEDKESIQKEEIIIRTQNTFPSKKSDLISNVATLTSIKSEHLEEELVKNRKLGNLEGMRVPEGLMTVINTELVHAEMGTNQDSPRMLISGSPEKPALISNVATLISIISANRKVEIDYGSPCVLGTDSPEKPALISNIGILISVISNKREVEINLGSLDILGANASEKLALVSNIATLVSIISNHQETISNQDSLDVLDTDMVEKSVLLLNITSLISIISKSRERNLFKDGNTGSLEKLKAPDEGLTKLATVRAGNSGISNTFSAEMALSSKWSEKQLVKSIDQDIIVYFDQKEGKNHIITMTNLTPKTKAQRNNLKTKLTTTHGGRIDKITEMASTDNKVKQPRKCEEIKNSKSDKIQPNKTQITASVSNDKAENSLDFLDEEFEADLDKIINSKNFTERATELHEVLDYKDNNEYLSKFQSNIGNSEEALEILVYANQRLVLSTVKKYKGLSTPAFTEDDMFQHGMIGLMEAAKRFDLSKGFEFSTYATHWIRQEVTRGIMNNSNTIRIPVHMGELINKVRRLERKSDNNFGFVDYEWIASELEVSLDKVINAVRVHNTFMRNVSLDTPVGTDETTTIRELIKDETVLNLDSVIIEKSLQSIISSVLDELKPRERDVIIKRFGLDGQGERTLETIGKDYNVTRERIRQIESKALKRLKHPNRSEKLREYYEV